MRICCWNVRRAVSGSPVWTLFDEISPDLALLQEVGGLPKSITDHYQVAIRKAAGKTNQQRFNTAILVRGELGPAIPLTTQWEWVNHELDRFSGNLVAHQVMVHGQTYRVLSAYSPAWPIDPARLADIDVDVVKLKLNPNVWVTELFWAALQGACTADDAIPWVAGGDLNASETFDTLWSGGPRGNREFLDRMIGLGFTECLRCHKGRLVPTFRNPRGGRIIHQMDHLFVCNALAAKLVSCDVAAPTQVFGKSLSDHLPIVLELSDVVPI